MQTMAEVSTEEPRLLESLEQEITALASACGSCQEFVNQALRCIAAKLECPFAAISILNPPVVIEDYCHRGSTDPNFWRPTVQGFLTEILQSREPRARLLQARNSSLKLGLIAVPLLSRDGVPVGGLSLIARMDEEQVRSRVGVLESIGALLVGLARDPFREGPAQSTHDTAGVKGLLKAAGCESPEELAFTLVNSVRSKIGCHQVAIGMVTGRAVTLLAISGQDTIRTHNPAVGAIRQAMEECLDLGRSISIQDEAYSEGALADVGCRLHNQWHLLSNRTPVASILLKSGDRCLAVLSIQHKREGDLSQAALGKIEEMVKPFAPALVLLDRANRGIARHVRESLRETLTGLLKPGQYVRKALLAGSLFCLLWLVFGTLGYDVAVTGVVQPVHMRHVGMPYDGVLASVERVAGDSVRAGDVLCRLDTRDLELQLAECRAELAIAEHKAQRAMAAKAPAEASLAAMEARRISAQIDLLEHRMERAIIRSPLDGLVVSGDLRTMVGSALTQGAPLMQVASADGWIAELRVPEFAAADIREGLTARFACSARPEQVLPLKLTRVRPSTVVVDQQTVFVAEAESPAQEAWLRPGMEGVAKIVVGRRATWWVLFHSVTDYLRVALWL